MVNKYFRFQIILTTVIQAITSAVIPPILIAFIAKWAVDKFGIGEWLMAVAVILGLTVGFTTMISTIIKSSHILASNDEAKKAGKNDEK